VDAHFLMALLASIVADSAPLVIATVGETLTERAGVTNLSLDGTILLSAMTGFAVAYVTDSVALGFLVAAAVGAAVALVVAVASMELHQNQVAVGFVLTMLCADLSSFLGNPFVRKPGPSVGHLSLPVLDQIPVLGPILFDQNPLVYLSFLAVIVSWIWIFRTRPGLVLQGLGERPAASFARGANVRFLRYAYTLAGGALVGFAGAGYSLAVKLGWSYHLTFGLGWIALSIVIFGGWDPLRAALGSYLFGALGSLGSLVQGIPELAQAVPTQVFQAAPFAVMILVLLLVSSKGLDRLLALLPGPLRRLLGSALRVSPPAALGAAFEQD
jgi:general nucleoside transport system permease protein